jgi:hypothetical protein
MDLQVGFKQDILYYFLYEKPFYILLPNNGLRYSFLNRILYLICYYFAHLNKKNQQNDVLTTIKKKNHNKLYVFDLNEHLHF